MGFNPYSEKGIPLESQIRNWTELNVTPYNKKEVDPYTRSRIILMNGIEVEAAFFGHQWHRHLSDHQLKMQLAMIRRVEQQQQKAINWLSPGDETPLETTIGYEQVAVDLTAFLAQREPDPYVKQVFDFGLLEDFDHLYRYANLLEMTQGVKAEELVGGYTEITPGRPTIYEHRHPFDDVRQHVGRAASPLTKLQVLTLTAGEQQTMNFYMNVGNQLKDQVGRGVYLEIAEIEEQHVTQYGSLLDPSASWYEMALLHEYNECYLYWSFMTTEKDQKIRAIWERHLAMELEHLRIVAELYRSVEKREAQELLPDSFPDPILFESNIDYVREILAEQVPWNATGTQIGPTDKIPENPRYDRYQKEVNDGGTSPTQQVIERWIAKNGRDYRFEVAGEHPVRSLRSRESVVTH